MHLSINFLNISTRVTVHSPMGSLSVGRSRCLPSIPFEGASELKYCTNPYSRRPEQGTRGMKTHIRKNRSRAPSGQGLAT